MSSKAPTLFGAIHLPCTRPCEETLAALKDLVKGHASWETPIEVALLIRGSSSELDDFQKSKAFLGALIHPSAEAFRALDTLCPPTETPLALLLVDGNRNLRGCYPATTEGTQEAFHRSVRVWQAQTQPPAPQGP